MNKWKLLLGLAGRAPTGAWLWRPGPDQQRLDRSPNLHPGLVRRLEHRHQPVGFRLLVWRGGRGGTKGLPAPHLAGTIEPGSVSCDYLTVLDGTQIVADSGR